MSLVEISYMESRMSWQTALHELNARRVARAEGRTLLPLGSSSQAGPFGVFQLEGSPSQWLVPTKLSLAAPKTPRAKSGERRSIEGASRAMQGAPESTATSTDALITGLLDQEAILKERLRRASSPSEASQLLDELLTVQDRLMRARRLPGEIAGGTPQGSTGATAEPPTTPPIPGHIYADPRPAPNPPAAPTSESWDPRTTSTPGDSTSQYGYYIDIYSDYMTSTHVLVRIVIFSNSENRIIWSRTFSWIPGLTGWDSFTNNGAHGKFRSTKFLRHPYSASRSWTITRPQFLRVIDTAAWWINHKSYDASSCNCLFFAWAMLGAAGVNPFDLAATSGSDPGSAVRDKGLGDDGKYRAAAAGELFPSGMVKLLNEYWGLRPLGGALPSEMSVPRNEGPNKVAK